MEEEQVGAAMRQLVEQVKQVMLSTVLIATMAGVDSERHVFHIYYNNHDSYVILCRVLYTNLMAVSYYYK